MKKLIIAICFLLMISLLVACNNNSDNGDASTDITTEAIADGGDDGTTAESTEATTKAKTTKATTKEMFVPETFDESGDSLTVATDGNGMGDATPAK